MVMMVYLSVLDQMQEMSNFASHHRVMSLSALMMLHMNCFEKINVLEITKDSSEITSLIMLVSIKMEALLIITIIIRMHMVRILDQQIMVVPDLVFN